jgi:hypothetical protein
MKQLKPLASVTCGGETYEMYEFDNDLHFRRVSDGRAVVSPTIKKRLLNKARRF